VPDDRLPSDDLADQVADDVVDGPADDPVADVHEPDDGPQDARSDEAVDAHLPTVDDAVATPVEPSDETPGDLGDDYVDAGDALVVPAVAPVDDAVRTAPAEDASEAGRTVGTPEDGTDDTLVGPDDDEPAEGTAQPASLAPAPTRTGWRALGHAMAPRATRAQLGAGVLCALLGFAVVVQVRQNDETALAGLRQSELVRILDETTERSDELRREVTELRTERDALDSGSDGQAAALDSLRRSAIMQGILSGRLPAEGPGVQVTLIDPAGDLQPVTMLNLLEELRNAGAEAIQLGDHRITASSSFTGTKGHVLVDGVPLRTPYVWLAIGDPSTLSIALQIPGGAMATVRRAGATGTVSERDLVQVTATRVLLDPRYATPVQDEE